MQFLETINTISKFTETAVVSPNKTYFTDSSMQFFGCVDSSTPGDSEVGFYENISNFMRVLSLFDNPEITKDGETLKIQDDSANAKFVTSDIRLIRNMQTTDIQKVIEQTTSVEPTLQCKITKDVIQRIRTANAAILNSKVVVHSRNGSVEFIVKDVDVLMSSSNSYRFKIDGVSTKDCSVVLDAGFFGKMGSEFDLKLVFSNKASTFRAILANDTTTIVIPTAHTAV